jgi:hypothetical protein
MTRDNKYRHRPIIIGTRGVSQGRAIGDPLASLEIEEGGILPAMITNAEMAAIVNPTPGLIYYNTDLNALVVFDSVAWSPATGGSITGLVDPMSTAGDMIIRNAGNSTVRLPVGLIGQVLTVTGGVPTWSTPPVATNTITVREEGVTVNTAITTLNFIGATVTAVDAGSGVANVNVTGVTTYVGLSDTPASITANSIVVGNSGGSALAHLPPGANGQVLSITAGAPTWSTPVVGLVDPMSTVGDLISRNLSNTTTRLAVGTAGQVLTVTGGVPAWATPVAGFTDPMTTAGDVIIRTAGNITARLAAGTAGQVLTIAAGVPTWTTPVSGFADPMTTVGDTIIRAAGNVTARLPVGTNGQVLTVTAGAPGWTTPASGFADPMTTVGDIITRDGTNTTVRLPVGNVGQALVSDGTVAGWANVATANITSGTLDTATANRIVDLGGFSLFLSNTNEFSANASTITLDSSVDTTFNSFGQIRLRTVGASNLILESSGASDIVLTTTNEVSITGGTIAIQSNSGINIDGGTSVTIDGPFGVTIRSVVGNVTMADTDNGGLVLPQSANPVTNVTTPVDGMIAYNTTLDDFQAYRNGAWGLLAVAGAVANITTGTLATATANRTVNMGGFDLSFGNVNSWTITSQSASLVSANNISIDSSTGGVFLTGNNINLATDTSDIVVSCARNINMSSTVGGLIIPTATNPSSSVTTPVNGMMAFNSTSQEFQGYLNGSWQSLAPILKVNPVEFTATFTATENTIHAVNTTGGVVTVNPPASPVSGMKFAVVDSRGTSGINPITVLFTGATQPFYAAADDLVISSDRKYVELVYINGTVGWISNT